MSETLDNMTYPPLDVPKAVADGVWVVDGPTVSFGVPGMKLRHPTRMTVIALQDGSLFLHSPTKPTPELQAEIDALGRVRWIIGPNRVHYWWIPEWHAAYPDAEVWLAPKIQKQAERAGKPISFATHELEAASTYPWDSVIQTLATPRGSFMTEYDFFHRPSRTLVLTDLVENFELQKVDSRLMRLFIRFAGATGKTPRDIRLFVSRKQLKRALETMIAWQPERVILSHGRWFEHDAAAELRRVYGWLLG